MNRHSITIWIFVLGALGGSWLSLAAQACSDVPQGYYASVEGVVGEELRSGLRGIISRQREQSYSAALDVFYSKIECQDNGLRCIYTSRQAAVEACSRHGARRSEFNCEHAWPQGYFDRRIPMVSDFHHMFASDETANNMRSSFPFGIVTDVEWESGGSKRGFDGARRVFEPRDDGKGNIARALLYMMVRYHDAQLDRDGTYMDERQRGVLLLWNQADPPDAAECSRQERIFDLQGNRNPFVDRPQFATDIWGPPPDVATLTARVGEPPAKRRTPRPVPVSTPTDRLAVVNGDFEHWTVRGDDGPPDGWLVSYFGLGARREADAVQRGQSALRLATVADRVSLEQELIGTLIPGQRYELSLWAQDMAPDGSIRAWIAWSDARGKPIESSDFTEYSSDKATWQQLRSRTTVPPRAAKATVRIRVYNRKQQDVSFVIDDLQVKLIK